MRASGRPSSVGGRQHHRLGVVRLLGLGLLEPLRETVRKVRRPRQSHPALTRSSENPLLSSPASKIGAFRKVALCCFPVRQTYRRLRSLLKCRAAHCALRPDGSRPAWPRRLLDRRADGLGPSALWRGNPEDVTGSIPKSPAKLSRALESEDWRRAIAALAPRSIRREAATSVNWDNPQSGAKGSFTPVGQAYPMDARICRAFLATCRDEGQAAKTFRARPVAKRPPSGRSPR